MDDDDLFGTGPTQPTIQTAPQTQSSQSTSSFDGDLMGGLGGISFTPANPTPPQPQNNDLFNILGLSMGGPQPVVSQPPANQGFGGDLLGFG